MLGSPAMTRPSTAGGPVPDDDVVPTGTGPRRRGVLGWQPVGLLLAAHPKQTVLTAVAMAGVAAFTRRPLPELGLVLVTVLVGQTILAWHNDLVDRHRDARHGVPGKPIADGRVEPGNAWYALLVAALLVVPLAISHGVLPGLCYLASLVTAAAAATPIRRTPLSFLPWAATGALYVPFLGAGGWGGDERAAPVSWTMVALWAGLGVAVHLLRSLPGLVPDHEDDWHSLPLLIALRTGATGLLILALLLAAGLVVAIVLVGQSSGLGGATLTGL